MKALTRAGLAPFETEWVHLGLKGCWGMGHPEAFTVRVSFLCGY